MSIFDRLFGAKKDQPTAQPTKTSAVPAERPQPQSATKTDQPSAGPPVKQPLAPTPSRTLVLGGVPQHLPQSKPSDVIPGGKGEFDYTIVSGSKPLLLAAYQQAHKPGASDEEILSAFHAEGGAAVLLEFNVSVKQLFYDKDYKVLLTVTCACGVPITIRNPLEICWVQGMSWASLSQGSNLCPSCYESVTLYLSEGYEALPIGERALLMWAHYYGHSGLLGQEPSPGPLTISVTGLKS